MMLKRDLLGWLLNVQVALSGLAVLLLPVVCRVRRVRYFRAIVWLAVLPVGVGAIVWRWVGVGHPPMRNLFEAFLWLPPILAGLTMVTWWRERVGTVWLDALLGFVVAFPLAFVFSSAEGQLPPALQSVFFVPHVLGYMLAYALLVRGFALACVGAERASRRNVGWGFLLLTVALGLGSMWGNEAWGAYWQWDPKEQWSLATWLIYAASFHCRHRRWARLTLLGAGVVAIVLTVTWINLSKLFPGMHSYAGL